MFLVVCRMLLVLLMLLGQARSEAGLPEKLVLYYGRHDYGTRVLQGTGNLAVVARHGARQTSNGNEVRR